MKTEHRIYVALAILVLLGIGLFATLKKKKEETATHSATAASAELPKIGVPKDDVEKITKVELKNADKSNLALEKKGEPLGRGPNPGSPKGNRGEKSAALLQKP